jgi:hypothetical protein
MNLNGRQIQQFSVALYSAFPSRASLSQMVRFNLDVNLEVIAGGESLADVTFNLISWAEAQGRVEELVVKARESNPGNPVLAAFAREVLPPLPSDPLPRGDVIINRSVRGDSVDLEVFMRIRTLARAVCRIELKDGYGTGFLVGPDLLLTCHHVIADLLSADGSSRAAPGVTLRFDFSSQNDGAPTTGRTCHLASDWLIAKSPQDELNFALLRLDDAPGRDPVPRVEPGMTRGWVSIAKEVTVVPGEALVVIGHPMAMPLSVILAAQHSLDEHESLLYEGLGAPGLSGAPCFSRQMDFMAMHAGRAAVSSSDLSGRVLKRALLGRAIVAQPDVRAALMDH